MHARFLPRAILGQTLIATAFYGPFVYGQTPASGGKPEAAKLTNPTPATPESLATGKQVFEKYCVVCHRASGRGGLPIGPTITANLTDDKWDHGSTDGEIFDTIKNGVPPSYTMPPWEAQIGDADIWNLVDYIRSLHDRGETNR